MEWHKRECEKEMLTLNGERSLFDGMRDLFGLPPRRNRYYEHRLALTALGYLEEREFIFDEQPGKAFARTRSVGDQRNSAGPSVEHWTC